MKWAKGPVQKVSAYRGEAKVAYYLHLNVFDQKGFALYLFGERPFYFSDRQTDRLTVRQTDIQTGEHRQTNRLEDTKR